MFKRIIQLLFKFILLPAKTWRNVSGKEDTDNDLFVKNYLYPVFGIIALASFLGIFISKREFDVELALKTTISITLTVFLSFYLASFLLNEFIRRKFRIEVQTYKTQRFVAYSSSLIYIIYIISSLVPSLFFIKIIALYTFFIIWTGADSFMEIDGDKKLNFTIFAGLIIILSPYLLETILSVVVRSRDFLVI